jgi:hypothetical protein
MIVSITKKSVLCYGLLGVLAAVCASGRNLYQYRFGLGLQWDFYENWKLAARQDFRYTNRSDLGFYYRATDMHILYSGLTSWLDLGGGFKAAFAETNAHETFRQDRPYASLILKGNLKGLNINNRVLGEYRNNEVIEDFWSLRNRFRLKYPVVVGTWEIAPYLADELFFYFNETYDNFKSNRVKVGMAATSGKILSADLYYFWERGKFWEPGENFVLQAIGGGVTFRFQ